MIECNIILVDRARLLLQEGRPATVAGLKSGSFHHPRLKDCPNGATDPNGESIALPTTGDTCSIPTLKDLTLERVRDSYGFANSLQTWALSVSSSLIDQNLGGIPTHSPHAHLSHLMGKRPRDGQFRGSIIIEMHLRRKRRRTIARQV